MAEAIGPNLCATVSAGNVPEGYPQVPLTGYLSSKEGSPVWNDEYRLSLPEVLDLMNGQATSVDRAQYSTLLGDVRQCPRIGYGFFMLSPDAEKYLAGATSSSTSTPSAPVAPLGFKASAGIVAVTKDFASLALSYSKPGQTLDGLPALKVRPETNGVYSISDASGTWLTSIRLPAGLSIAASSDGKFIAISSDKGDPSLYDCGSRRYVTGQVLLLSSDAGQGFVAHTTTSSGDILTGLSKPADLGQQINTFYDGVLRAKCGEVTTIQMGDVSVKAQGTVDGFYRIPHKGKAAGHCHDLFYNPETKEFRFSGTFSPGDATPRVVSFDAAKQSLVVEEGPREKPTIRVLIFSDKGFDWDKNTP